MWAWGCPKYSEGDEVTIDGALVAKFNELLVVCGAGGCCEERECAAELS